MDIFNLVAKLTLDKTEYDSGLSEAESGIGKAFGTAAKVGGAAMAATSAAVVGFGGQAVSAGRSFDTAMSQVAATMGKTTDEIGDLRSFAQEMGATTSFSATQAAEALNYMALAGYDSETSMKMLPNVLNLAAAGGMSLATASDMVTDAQSALGLSLDQTEGMVDQMALTSSKTNTSVSQLGDAMLTIGATARGVSGGTAELSAVLGVLADNGIKGSEGGTHLRNAILSLQTPTKSGIAALSKLGMTYEDMYDSAGNMRSLPEIFLQMQSAMEGMTQQSKDAIISGVFNKTDLAALNALIGTSAERWDELDTAIGDATGSAQKMADTQLDNLNGDVTLFQSALEGAEIAISDGITPTLRKFVQSASTGMSNVTKAFKDGGLTGAVDAFGDWLTEAIGLITENIPSIVEAGAGILMALVQGLIKNLPSMAKGALQIVTTLVTSVTNAAPKLAESALTMISSLTQGIQDNLPGLIPAALNAIMEFSGGLRESAGELFDAGLGLIMALADALIENIPEFVKTVPTIVTNIAGIINDNAPKLLMAGMTLVVQLAAGLVQAIPTIIMELPKIVQAIFSVFQAMNWLQLGATIINGIKEGITTLSTELPNALKDIGNTAKEWLSAIDWKTLGSDIIDLIKIGVESVGSALATFFKTLGETMLNFLKEVDWVSVGKAIWTGITDEVSKIATWFKEKFDAAYNAIAGEDGAFSKIGAWAKGVWGAITGAFGDAKDGIKGWFESKFKAAYNAIAGPDGVFSKIGEWAKGIWSKITGAFGDAKDGIAGWFSGKFKAAYDAIAGENGAFATIGTWASGAWSKITSAFGDAKDGIAGWFQTHFTNAYNAIAGEDGAFSKIGTWATNTWDAVKEVFGSKDGVSGWFKEKFDDAYDAIAGKDGAFSQIGTWATNTWDAVKDVFGSQDGVTNWFKEKFDDAYDAIAGKDGAFSQIGSWASGVWDMVKSPFEGDKSSGGIVKWFGDKFTDAYDAIAGLKGPFSTVGSWASDVLADILGPFEDPVKGIAQKLKDFGNDAFDNLKDVFSWKNVQNFFSHIFDNIHIPVPEFYWEGDWDFSLMDGDGIGAPALRVRWNDKGGIYYGPSIIGVGEKRPEFVGALDDLRKIVREESGGSANVTMNIYGSEGQDIHQLAEIIEDELQGILQRREAGFA